MLERVDNRPLAAKVRDTILQAILSQSFDGGRLPSEDELANMVNVSRTTIRTALHSLEQDGIITRRRALGTTVNEHVRPDLVALQQLAGFDWLLREKGHEVKVDVSWARGPVTPELSQLFGSPPHDEALLTEKLFFAGGQLAIYVRDLVLWEEIAKPPRGEAPAIAVRLQRPPLPGADPPRDRGDRTRRQARCGNDQARRGDRRPVRAAARAPLRG